MPIYGDKLTNTQYKVVTKIEIKEFAQLLKYFETGKNKFPYKNNKDFLKTVKFDKAGDSLKYYKEKVLVDIIFDTNYRKDIKGFFPFIAKFENEPKYGIDDFTYGIMMESLIQNANNNIPSTMNYKFDICGSWTNGKVIILKKK